MTTRTKHAMDVYNPYWHAVRGVCGNDLATDYQFRRRYVRTYAWAIPDPATLKFIASHTRDSGIVEMGAGTGYWASLLTQLGVLPYTCFDIAPPGRVNNPFFGVTMTFYPVCTGTPRDVKNYSGYTLFLCWPPHVGDMAVETLHTYTGKKLVYIGEGRNGRTANDAFFDQLDRAWKHTASHPIAQWKGMCDSIEIYERP